MKNGVYETGEIGMNQKALQAVLKNQMSVPGWDNGGPINKDITNQDLHLERWSQGQAKDR